MKSKASFKVKKAVIRLDVNTKSRFTAKTKL